MTLNSKMHHAIALSYLRDAAEANLTLEEKRTLQRRAARFADSQGPVETFPALGYQVRRRIVPAGLRAPAVRVHPVLIVASARTLLE